MTKTEIKLTAAELEQMAAEEIETVARVLEEINRVKELLAAERRTWLPKNPEMAEFLDRYAKELHDITGHILVVQVGKMMGCSESLTRELSLE